MSYESKREELREAELDLMRRRERVAQLRRDLPEGDVVGDYTFVDVESGEDVKLSELFTGPNRSLILYHYMFGKKEVPPCPMCSM
jgi:predicted dithiol-disulfide oxidoreductase (DUF899 family)